MIFAKRKRTMNITSRGAAVEAAITIASGGQLVKRDAGLTSAGVAVASCTGAGMGWAIGGTF
ncbi:hypothetical protein C5H21_08305 [Xylella fastidiosa]|nr:hypothetical protein C5H21_12375 [Xylella fastidiosa]TNV97685.1 hypothetical protein C5H21_12340 [Xylella fastidiosa]TNV97695.1 hypothetical protein C5H21_12275 [Xylella fastidiosa]TNV98445.1 hypothetical protein C5H21_08305 [Xylella fastidiosa]